MSDHHAAPPMAAGRRWFVAALLLGVTLAVASAGVALSRLSGTDSGAGAATSAPAAPPGPGLPGSVPSAAVPSATVPSAAVPSAAAPSTAGPHRSRTAGPRPDRGLPNTTSTTTRRVSTTPPPATPAIVRFRVVSEPSCPSGTAEGRPVVLEWKVTGADRTILAVDGPGLYAEYGTTGSTKVRFPCHGKPGSHQTHTYTLTAFDGDATTSATLAVRAPVRDMTAA